ncbi:MAG: tetratricopeptide repeat protein [Planctomycetota bacterium]
MYMLAQEHGKSGEHLEAIAWYDQCLEADPEYTYAYFHKARAELSMQRRSEARATLERGIEQATSIQDAKALGELEHELGEHFS